MTELRAVWAYRRPLLAFVVACAVVTYLVSLVQSSTYEAKALVQIVPGFQSQGAPLTDDQEQSLANTYLQVARTNAVYDGAVPALRVSRRTVADATDAEVQPNVLILELSGRRGDAPDAARFANAYANAFSRYVERLQALSRRSRVTPLRTRIDLLSRQLQDLRPGDPARRTLQAEIDANIEQITQVSAASVDTARVLQHATPPTSASSPRPFRNAALALLAALIAGVAAVFAYAALAPRAADRRTGPVEDGAREPVEAAR
jgi:uncharacterized protein involved in exopolysaccharide biosynthesis